MERELIEVQIRAIVNEPARLYDLLHAIVEECYRREACDYAEQTWRRIAQHVTRAETAIRSLR